MYKNIYSKSHTKQNKKKVVKASASMGSIPKQPQPMTQSRSLENTSDSNIHHKNRDHKNRDIIRAHSSPQPKKEEPNEEVKNDKSEQKIEAIPESLSQYIDESHANTDIHLGEFQNLKWNVLFSDDFWAKPAQLFHEAWSDRFVKKIHHERGSTGLKIGEWQIDNDDEKIPDNQPKTYVRKVEYISKIKDPPPFMPAKTEVYATERFRFYGSNCVVVDMAISTPNIKYGDYFLICNRYIFSLNEQDENKTHMEVSIAYKWVKKTWFEKIIVSKATSEAEEGVAFWASKLHDQFPPKESKEKLLQKQISGTIIDDKNGNISPRGHAGSRSPRRRVIDQKFIDYFHTERKRKDIIIQDWLKPIGEIFIDIIKEIIRPSSWKNLYNNLLKIDDVEQHDNLITIKHALFVIFLLIILFLICNFCWMFLWIWYSSSLNNIIYKQNEILQQQSQAFVQLLQFLQENNMNNDNNNNNNNNTLECVE